MLALWRRSVDSVESGWATGEAMTPPVAIAKTRKVGSVKRIVNVVLVLVMIFGCWRS